ncbi:MAG: DUF1657 domain-containing protein [Clostridium sp.]|uniref:DUF1657 domain-containing protein n=1 Tax=Clostridium pasteurianum BC1 TaxID=86416 RepID=R4K342_CLOPA|nr:DUF1657 domain-containing protein [Clostridium pasteurianum]AGK96161.1 Protein of unknown function (DUF1657) [Clostridium pasteurianum BC1]
MTVGTQMQQAIAGVQSAAATMKTFALQTENEAAKKDFQQLAKTFEDSLQILNGRLKHIQEEEPQYTQQ